MAKTIRKPSNLIYGLEDKPPIIITILLAIQHISVISIGFLFPVIIVRQIGGTIEESIRFVSASMLAGGIAILAQSMKKGPIGSGYLCPEVCGPSYLASSLLAAKTGGLSLVFGMTIIASLLEGILAKLLKYLRMFFPSEVTGLIVIMVGLTVIKIAGLNFFGYDHVTKSISIPSLYTAILTLAIMISLNIWGKGKFKLFSALIGMIAGYFIAIFFGVFDFSKLTSMPNTQIFVNPLKGHPGWSFDIALLVPFLVAVLCSTLKTVGDITTCQRSNDADWKRPDINNISKGLLADGFGAFVSGIVGGFGQSTSSANIGLAIGTGATSRIIAITIGIILILMSFIPNAAIVFAVMPAPVLGATLIFALSFMVTAGMQIIMSRMIDSRKTFVVGLSMIFGLSVDILPNLYSSAPDWLAPIVSSSLSASTIMAIILNFIFRLGVKKTAELAIQNDHNFTDTIFEFLDKQGGLWGARREVIQKATFALCESVESIIKLNGLDTKITIKASFDEYNLRILIEYEGEKLDISNERPNPEDLISESDFIKMSMFLVKNYTSSFVIEQKNNTNILKLNFIH
jgi:NCS2 family nucleobase:cation symporter-2